MTTPIIIDPSFLFPYLFLGLDLSLPVVGTLYDCFSKKDKLDLSAERVRRLLIAQVDKLASAYQFQEYEWVWAENSLNIIDFDFRQLLRIRLPADSCDANASVAICFCPHSNQLLFRSRSSSAAPRPKYFLLWKERKWQRALRRALLGAIFLHKNPGQAKIVSGRNSNFEVVWEIDFNPSEFCLLLYLFPPAQTTIEIEGKVLFFDGANSVKIDFGIAKTGLARLSSESWTLSPSSMIDLPTWESCSRAIIDISNAALWKRNKTTQL